MGFGQIGPEWIASKREQEREAGFMTARRLKRTRLADQRVSVPLIYALRFSG